MKWAVFFALVGCGSSHAASDAASDAFTGCTVTLSGNFTDQSSVPACAMRSSDGTLTLAVPSAMLDQPLQAVVQLGTVGPGMYSSETVATWSATATRTVTHSACMISAGNAVAPHGDFTLTLGEPGASMLAMHLYVHAAPFTDCGADLIETLEVVF